MFRQGQLNMDMIQQMMGRQVQIHPEHEHHGDGGCKEIGGNFQTDECTF